MLGKDEMGDTPECNFNYASVVGMLLYLTGHTHPELTFAVSQCARFTYAPKRSHELALIRIGQYLKGCRDDGLIMKPTKLNEIQMDVYVDSDFLGLHGKEKMLFGVNLHISIEPSQFHWYLFPTSYQLRLTMATPPTLLLI